MDYLTGFVSLIQRFRIRTKKVETKSSSDEYLCNTNPRQPTISSYEIEKADELKMYIQNHFSNLCIAHEERVDRFESVFKRIECSRGQQKQGSLKKLIIVESNYLRLRRTKLKADDFLFIPNPIGQGTFGKVFVVKQKETQSIYAMKIQSKEEAVGNYENWIRAERDLLVSSDSEWIVKLYFSFQDNLYLFLVMEYMEGGTLRNIIDLLKDKFLSEDDIKFYIAEIALAIDYVHSISFAHRDILKTAKCATRYKGPLQISRFRFSLRLGVSFGPYKRHNSNFYREKKPVEAKRECFKEFHQQAHLSSQTMGIHDSNKLKDNPKVYMDPEELSDFEKNKRSDWCSLGLIMNDMIFRGQPSPLNNRFRDDLSERFSNLNLKEKKISQSAVSLILKFFNSITHNHISNINDLKEDEWFQFFDFDKIRSRKAPIILEPKIFSTNDPDFREYRDVTVFGKRARDISPKDSNSKLLGDWAFHNYTWRRYTCEEYKSLFDIKWDEK